MDRPAVRDSALLLFRLVLGTIFTAHGFEKLFLLGPGEVSRNFEALGIPQPALAAWVTGCVELLGGALLIIGLLSTIIAGLLAAVMVGAYWFAHLGHGLFISQGGGEYVLVLIAALIMVVVFGPGRFSVDGLVYSRDQL